MEGVLGAHDGDVPASSAKPTCRSGMRFPDGRPTRRDGWVFPSAHRYACRRRTLQTFAGPPEVSSGTSGGNPDSGVRRRVSEDVAGPVRLKASAGSARCRSNEQSVENSTSVGMWSIASRTSRSGSSRGSLSPVSRRRFQRASSTRNSRMTTPGRRRKANLGRPTRAAVYEAKITGLPAAASTALGRAGRHVFA